MFRELQDEVDQYNVALLKSLTESDLLALKQRTERILQKIKATQTGWTTDHKMSSSLYKDEVESCLKLVKKEIIQRNGK